MIENNFVTLNREKCKGCLLCLDICPNSLFIIDDELNESGFKPIKMVDQEYCLNCMDCYLICPHNAFIPPQKLGSKWAARFYWLGRQSKEITNNFSDGIEKIGNQIKSIIPVKKVKDNK